MRTVNEVSRLAGVSVRTLHHYDAIGLLKPTEITEAGYRLYDTEDISRLQNILMFRELEFPLKEIKEIIDSPNFDWKEALVQQIEMLELRRKHIEKLISFAREIQKKGVNAMNFDAFDKSEMEQYKAEAKAKWGDTKAWQEYEQKTAAQNERDYDKLANDLMAMFSEMGAMKQMDPGHEAVQEKIAALQQFITENYYVCTDEILSGLGEMYVCDERFRKNIDKAGGEGTAEFVRQAISVFCAG